jgi:hypothetical protein
MVGFAGGCALFDAACDLDIPGGQALAVDSGSFTFGNAGPASFERCGGQRVKDAGQRGPARLGVGQRNRSFWIRDAGNNRLTAYYVVVEHLVRPDDADELVTPTAAAPMSLWRRVGRLLSGLMADREPDTYSSISPRRPDGTRTRPFFFNGNGRGR